MKIKHFLITLFGMVALSSCSQNAENQRSNPLLEDKWDTPFSVAPFDRILAEDYLEAFEVAFSKQRDDVEEIISNDAKPSFESVVLPLDQSSAPVDRLRDLFEMSEAAISTPEYQAVSETVTPRMSEFSDSLYMNRDLFTKVKEVYDNRKELELDSLQNRLTERVYNKFVRHGALLDEEQRKKLSQINSQIALFSVQFTHNLIAANEAFVLKVQKEDLDGIPYEIRGVAQAEGMRRGEEKDVAVFTLSPSSMIPFLTYSQNRELRKEIFEQYQKRGAETNAEIVRQVSALRAERAKLLGYSTHAEYVISEQIAGKPEAAMALVDKVWTPALEKLNKQIIELKKLFNDDFPDEKFEAWDWWFYAEKLRKNEYKLSSSETQQYFTVDRVRAGAFTLSNRLYGLVFRPIDAPIYHHTLSVYEVLDNDNEHLGVLYLDLYSRAGKASGAWCGNLREQRYDGEQMTTPVIGVSCNFAPPTGGAETMLTLREVETFFHEMGHALHFLMQDVAYHGLAAVEGDFVEFPSQINERWAFEPELMRLYALHRRSLQPINQTLMDKIVNTQNFGQAFSTISYLSAAILDLELHSLSAEEASTLDLEAFENRILREERKLPEEVEPIYHLSNFPHIFSYDYSAGYYFYLWADLYARDAFGAFSKSGNIFSKEWADKFRAEVLERGGELPGDALYRNFRGADPRHQELIEGRGLN